MEASESNHSEPRRPLSIARILALCLWLSLALIAANVTYSALQPPPDTLQARAGDLLFVSTFAVPTDDWDLYEGRQRALIVEEQLEIAVDTPQTAAWSLANPRFADFDASLVAIAQSGPLDNAFGLVFHADLPDDHECAFPAVLLCGISEALPLLGAAMRQVLDQPDATRYHAFMISSDGYYSLWQTKAGAAKALSAWIPSDEITQGIGARNTIRIVAIGGRYQFFINEVRVPLCIPADESASSTFAGGECIDGSLKYEYIASDDRGGQLGLIAQSTATGGGGVVVTFDNLIVYSPAQSTSEEARL